MNNSTTADNIADNTADNQGELIEQAKRGLDMIANDYSLKLLHFLEVIRKSIIEPFCKKHGLEFVSGMGSYCFYSTKVYEHDVDNISPKKFQKQYRDMLDYKFDRCSKGDQL